MALLPECVFSDQKRPLEPVKMTTLTRQDVLSVGVCVCARALAFRIESCSAGASIGPARSPCRSFRGQSMLGGPLRKGQAEVEEAATEALPGGLLFFSTPKCLFLDSRPRDWSILFLAAACLFFDLQLFFSPAIRPRKRAQSFFQPPCIILSSLFLGPETSCDEPGIFFGTPKHLFLDLRCFF